MFRTRRNENLSSRLRGPSRRRGPRRLRGRSRACGPVAVAVAVLAAALAMACGDPFEPFLRPVPEEPGRATLVDFRTGPLQSPAAFDILTGQAVRTDQQSGWDFILFVTTAGVFEFRPRGMVIDEESDAGLLPTDRAFEEIEEAPGEGYIRRRPVPIAEGDVLFAVSRGGTRAGLRCRHFAKLEVLEVDAAAASATIRHIVNPNCERRTLVPGEQED